MKTTHEVLFKTTLKSIALATAFVALFQTGGCTVVGALRGAATDRHRTNSNQIDASLLPNLTKGEKLQVELSDSSKVTGFYGAATSHFGDQYETEYSRAKTNDSTLPLLGSRLSLKDSSNVVITGTLAGFEVKPGSTSESPSRSVANSTVMLYLIDDPSAGLRARDLKTVTELTMENGETIGTLDLEESVIDASLPSPFTLLLTVRNERSRSAGPRKSKHKFLGGDTLYIPMSQISAIRQSKSGAGTTGLFVGLAVDIAIAAAIAASGGLGFGGWR